MLEMKLRNYLNWLNIKVVKCFVHKRQPGCSGDEERGAGLMQLFR